MSVGVASGSSVRSPATAVSFAHTGQSPVRPCRSNAAAYAASEPPPARRLIVNEPRSQDIAEKTSYAREIAERLGSSKRPAGFADFFVTIVRELAKGRAVSREALAASLG